MKTSLTTAPLCLLLCLPLQDAFADDKKLEGRTELVQLQYPLTAPTPDNQFDAAVHLACKNSPPPKPSDDTRGIAGGAAAAAAIVDWLAGKAISAINKKLDRYIKEHTVTYTNPPQFYDIGLGKYWSSSKDPKIAASSEPPSTTSCVVLTRADCPYTLLDQKKTYENCETRLRFAAVMRHEGSYLRVLPIALEVRQIEARNSKHKPVAIGINFEIDAITVEEEGGRRWNSGTVPLVASAVTAGESSPRKHQRGDVEGSEFFSYSADGGELPWATAPVIPLPPGMGHPHSTTGATTGTIRISVSEVGTPSMFAKRLADLFSTKEDDLKGALGTALKKKLDIEEE